MAGSRGEAVDLVGAVTLPTTLGKAPPTPDLHLRVPQTSRKGATSRDVAPGASCVCPISAHGAGRQREGPQVGGG